MTQTRPFLFFSFFSHDKYSTNTINDKSVDGVLGTWIWGSRMVGADKSTKQSSILFLKNGPFPASFSFIFVFSIQLTVNVQYFFADDWIRTSDLLNWKRQLCQLRHNHCPSILFFIYWKFDWIVNCFLNWNRTRGFGKYRKTENSQR